MTIEMTPEQKLEKARAIRLELREKGRKLYLEGDKLYAEGDKLYAESRKVYLDALKEATK